MKIDDIVYTIVNDHICRCQVKGIMKDDKGDWYFKLFNMYTGKLIEVWQPDWSIFETTSSLVEKHVNDHVR